MQNNELDEKLRCLTSTIAEELGEILRCLVTQQIASKQAEIDQQLNTLRGLELLLNGNSCSPATTDNPEANPGTTTQEPPPP